MTRVLKQRERKELAEEAQKIDDAEVDM